MTEAQKGRMISLFADNQYTVAQIAHSMGCSKPTVQKWINKFITDGDVQRTKPPGRPKITTLEQDRRVVEAATNTPFCYIKQVARENEVGYNTALRRVQAAGLKRRRAAKRPFLTPAVRNQRMEFCRRMLQPEHRRNWRKIIFTDEKTFCSDDHSVKFVYRPNNRRYDERYIAHSTRSGRVSKSFWGWMCGDSLGEIFEITGKMNSEQYVEILNDFIASAPVLVGEIDQLIFQQDNASFHVSGETRRFLQTINFGEVLIWPAHSPDLNLIENIWAILEQMRKNTNVGTRAEIRDLVMRLWENLRTDTALVERLYKSLERRFRFVLENNGDWCV